MLRRLLAPAAVAACLAGTIVAARADTVKLKNGREIEGARVVDQGDSVRVDLVYGSITIPKSELAEVRDGPGAVEELARNRDELARRRLVAGDDPVALRALSGWCRAKPGLGREADDLLATARGIDLDRRLAGLRGTEDARPYLELWRSMAGCYPESERRFVLGRALAVDPENAEVRRELGQVKRDGRWVSLLEAARLDAEAETRAMVARGYVRHGERWMTRDEVAAEEARVAAERACAEVPPEPCVERVVVAEPCPAIVVATPWVVGREHHRGWRPQRTWTPAPPPAWRPSPRRFAAPVQRPVQRPVFRPAPPPAWRPQPHCAPQPHFAPQPSLQRFTRR